MSASCSTAPSSPWVAGGVGGAVGGAGVGKLIHPLLFVRDMGERYRREMLAHGGAKEPLLMVEGNWDWMFSH